MLILFMLYYPPFNAADQLWEEVRRVVSNISESIMLRGDFNKVFNSLDRKSKRFPRIGMTNSFPPFITYLKMVNLKLSGMRFTWRNGVSMSTIDRAFVSFQWIQKFPLFISLRPLKRTIRS